MRAKIEKTTRDLKRIDGVDVTGIMVNGQWYSIEGDHRKLYNKEVDLEIKGKWARLAQQQNGNGQAPTPQPKAQESNWEEYKTMVFLAKGLVDMIEPDVKRDDLGDLYIDRSQARVALMQTVLVAFRDGKITLPQKAPEPVPEPAPEDKEEGFPWKRAAQG